MADQTAMTTVITLGVGFGAGIAADWIKQWSSRWFIRNNLRNAIKAEIGSIIIAVNFYILEAIEKPQLGTELAAKTFTTAPTFHAFDFYWKEKREQLLMLPEWSRLQQWYASFTNVNDQEHPVLFKAIMLFESLHIPPLNKAVSKDTMTVILNTLQRDDIRGYKGDYFRNYIDNKGFHPDSVL
jgi:hypothetical protein